MWSKSKWVINSIVMATLLEMIILWLLFIASQFSFDYMYQEIRAIEAFEYKNTSVKI